MTSKRCIWLLCPGDGASLYYIFKNWLQPTLCSSSPLQIFCVLPHRSMQPIQCSEPLTPHSQICWQSKGQNQPVELIVCDLGLTWSLWYRNISLDSTEISIISYHIIIIMYYLAPLVCMQPCSLLSHNPISWFSQRNRTTRQRTNPETLARKWQQRLWSRSWSWLPSQQRSF